MIRRSSFLLVSLILLVLPAAMLGDTVYLSASSGYHDIPADLSEARRYLDYGGTDTYSIPLSLAAPVTIIDGQESFILFYAGTRINHTRFAADGVEFVFGEQALKLLGQPSAFSFDFAGKERNFTELATLFSTQIPYSGTSPVNGSPGCVITAEGDLDCDPLTAPNVILNDTGIDWCATDETNFLDCPITNYPGQDGDSGRDVTNVDDSDGQAGFSFTKLDASGQVLPASATVWNCVRDNVTGLIWEVKTDDGGWRDKDLDYSWDDAEQYTQDVNDFGLCGFSDWRMPTIKELAGIAYLGESYAAPVIDTAFFPNTLSANFWSTSTNASFPSSAWYVNFGDGQVDDDLKSEVNAVRLVRGDRWSLSFRDNDDGTVSDNNTGLIWAKCSAGQSGSDCSAGSVTLMTWQDALNYAKTKNQQTFASHNDWRLPTVKELHSLVDYSTSVPAIDKQMFPGTLLSLYWSSSPVALDSDTAWSIDFDIGFVHSFDANKKIGAYAVRLVRSKEFAPGLTHVITASVSPSASGEVNCTHNPVADGGYSICTAIAESGYSFASWSGACSGTNTNCSLNNVRVNQTIVANFIADGGNPFQTPRGINDTGINWCANDNVNAFCPISGYLGQDGDTGRDALASAGLLDKVGAGAAGFDFIKLDANGQDLVADASDWSCVRDNVTGLIWEVKTDDSGLRSKDSTYSWYESDLPGIAAGTEDGGNCNNSGSCDTEKYAIDINQIGLCGYTDWRLPTLQELVGITHLGRIDPSIDIGYFPNTLSTLFWSASPYADDSGYAWLINFNSGDINNYSKSNDYAVRLVRGEKWSSSFVDNSDGTVSEINTGLMWTKCSFGQTGDSCGDGSATKISWKDALAHAESAILAGYDDWRLPNRKELLALVDFSTDSPAIDVHFFPETPQEQDDLFWSASPDVDDSLASGITFKDGRFSSNQKNTDSYVRLVRKGHAFGLLSLQAAFSGSGTISSNPPGIDCGNDCQEYYEPGTSIILTATAASGYGFGYWSGACYGIDSANCTLNNITADQTVTANFYFIGNGGNPSQPPQSLNDTGIDWCADGNNNFLACSVAGYPNQDGDSGRDALARDGSLGKFGGGAAGFDFTKLAANGAELDANANEWSCVRDNVTGLVWEVKTDDSGLHDKDFTSNWGSAEWYVLNVSDTFLCGRSNWRLPTPQELMGIADLGRTEPDPIIDSDYFPNTLSTNYWSAPSYAQDSDYAWHVNFSDGDISYSDKSNTYALRLVSGEQETFHFDDNGNETVTDTNTGLMWAQCSVGQSGAYCSSGSAWTMAWQEALTYANNATLAGYNDWRLPTVKELHSLVDYSTVGSAIWQAFSATPASWFWSASPSVGAASQAWYVAFYTGSVGYYSKNEGYAVRLVRDTQ